LKKVNPFKPFSPVPTAMFAGRINEIDEFEKGLHQTKNGNPVHFLITGERGIGKSSLMALYGHLATGSIVSPDYDKFSFATINVTISEKTNLITFIKMIERGISRSLSGTESVRGFMKDTWEFVQRIRVMDSGIEKKDQTEDPDLVIDDFSYSLAQTVSRISNPVTGESPKDGIVFFIDEGDNACDDLQLGYFLKIVTEKLQRSGCNSVMFIVAGLPVVVDKLLESHESSIRVFTRQKIRVLNPDDRHFVIDKAIEEGNKTNADKTTITIDAKSHISTLSDGYPHFIQQFGYSSFDHNSDGEITEDDVLEGAFKTGGAIDSIGSRYYESQYREQIKSDEYREVLCIMAGNMNSWIKKSEIRKTFSGNDQTLSDALKALTTRNIILKNQSKLGEYRLQQRGFVLWIKLFGERKK